MASLLARTTLAAAEALSSKALPCLSAARRGMSVDQSFRDREHAAENLYFSKQEEKALRQLLKKMKTQADHHDKEEASTSNTQDDKTLEEITKKYKMSPEDLAAIKTWKHS